MKNQISDTLLEAAGNRNKYQYMLLCLTMLIWINVELILVSIPFLEKQPHVSYTDPKTQKEVSDVSLNYTICDLHVNYTRNKIYGHSWITEFDFECDKFLISIIGVVISAGTILGSISFPIIADHYGRKITVVIGLLGHSSLLMTVSFLHNFYAILSLTSLACVFCAISAYCSYMLLGEITNTSLRSIFGGFVNIGFCLCGVVYTLVYLATDSWRTVFRIVASIDFTSCLLFWFVVYESPKYFTLHRDKEEALKNLKDIARFNKREEDLDKVIEDEKESIERFFSEEERLERDTKERRSNKDKEGKNEENISNNEVQISNTFERKKKKKYSVLDLLKYGSQRTNFLVSCVFWYFISGNFFGLSINLKNLKGDVYMLGLIMYSLDCVALGTAGFLANSFGRKTMILVYLMVSSVSFALCAFISLPTNVFIGFSFLGRFSIGSVKSIIYFYSLELYPTVVKSYGFGYNIVFSRLGTLTIPLIIEYFLDYVNHIFMAVDIICWFLILLLPETLGRPIKDDIPELETIIVEAEKESLIVK